MENQELFDRYLAEMLNKEECAVFENRLSSDVAFAQEFKIYLTIIYNIRKEEEQDCIEFGYAMRSITKEQLQSIVGKGTDGKVGNTIPLFPHTDMGNRQIASGKDGKKTLELKEKKTLFKRPIVWLVIVIIIALIAGIKQCAS